MPTSFPIVGAHYRRSTAQSVANDSFDYVNFDTEIFDTHGFWDSGTANRFTIPTGQSGWYFAVGMIAWAADANDDEGVRGTGVVFSDTGENWGYFEWPNSTLSGALMWQTVPTGLRYFEEGEQVSLMGYQFNTDTSALDIAAPVAHPLFPSLQLIKATWLVTTPL